MESSFLFSDIENDAAGADSESEEEETSEGTPDDIQLPCHLQELVNKAIGDLEEDQARNWKSKSLLTNLSLSKFHNSCFSTH